MKPKKKQPVKALSMYAPHFNKSGGIYLPASSLHRANRRDPVYMLPATREAYDAMVEQGARGLYEASRKAVKAALHPKRRKAFRFDGWLTTKDEQRKWYRALSVSILASIGITKPASDAGREEGKT